MGQAHSTTADKKRSAKFYALRINDCKDCPGWPSGATAIVKQGAWKEIEEYDKVVYHDHQGVTHIGFINFTENNIILTQSMLPAWYPVQPIILPRKEIKRCDLVVMISYREEGVDQLLRSIRQHQRLKNMVKAKERRR